MARHLRVVRQEFDRRLGDSWLALADYLDIPRIHRERFRPGFEAMDLRQWLSDRDRLSELPDALTAVDRRDLARLLTSVHDEELGPGPTATTARPSPSRRWRRDWRPLVGAACVGLVFIGGAATYLVNDRPLTGGTTPADAASGSVPSSAVPAPTSAVASGLTNAVGPGTPTGRGSRSSTPSSGPGTPAATSRSSLESPPFTPIKWIKVDGQSVATVPDRSPQADFQISYDEVAPMSPARVDNVRPDGSCVGVAGEGGAKSIDPIRGGAVCGTTKTGRAVKLEVRLDPSDSAQRIVRVELL